jgi:hypothetical protein
LKIREAPGAKFPPDPVTAEQSTRLHGGPTWNSRGDDAAALWCSFWCDWGDAPDMHIGIGFTTASGAYVDLVDGAP